MSSNREDFVISSSTSSYRPILCALGLQAFRSNAGTAAPFAVRLQPQAVRASERMRTYWNGENSLGVDRGTARGCCSGCQFKVVAQNNGPDNLYVKEVTINGKPLNQYNTFAHSV